MTKYEWVKQEIESVLSEGPCEDRSDLDKFLEAVRNEGESLTRHGFFELIERHRPEDEDERDYFDYEFLDDHFYPEALDAAWSSPPPAKLPQVEVACSYKGKPLPSSFCQIGGEFKGIQSDSVPICKDCDTDMALLVQFATKDLDTGKEFPDLKGFKLFDAGNINVFRCPSCQTHEVTTDCY